MTPAQRQASFPSRNYYIGNTGSLDPTGRDDCPNGDYIPSTNQTLFVWRAWNPIPGWGSGTTFHCRVRYHNVANPLSPGAWSLVYEIFSANTVSGGATARHGDAGICHDGNGRWHAFLYNNPIMHWCTTNPSDPSSWVQQGLPVGGVLAQYQYPVAVGNTIYLFIGQNNSSPFNIVVQTITVSGQTSSYGSVVSLVNFGPTTTNFTFMDNPIIDSNGYITFTGNLGANSAANQQNVYFFRWVPSTGALLNIDGSVSTAAGSLPINLVTAAASYEVYSSGGLSANVANHNFDNAGNIHFSWSDANYQIGGVNGCVHGIWSGSGTSITNITAIIAGDAGSVVPKPDGTVDIYTSVANGRYSAGQGFDIYKTNVNGTTVGTPVLVDECANLFGLAGVNAIVNPHANARVIWGENGLFQSPSFVPSASVAQLKVKAYGDVGFAQSPNPKVITAPVLFLRANTPTLSTDNLSLVGTGSGGSGWLNVINISGGNIYLEFLCTHFTNNLGVGMANGLFNPSTTLLGSDAGGHSVGYFIDTGSVNVGGTTVATLGIGAVNSVIGVALMPASGTIGFNLNNAGWNNTPGNTDPTSGAISVSGIAPPWSPAVALLRSNDAFKVRPNSATWSYAAPTGFGQMTTGPLTS